MDWFTSGLPHIWLPYAQMQTAPHPQAVVSTAGSRITLADGRELIDGVASWWTACHGYNHPHIIKSMQAQLEKMPHVMFGGLVHEPALTLANRLATLTGLPRVFFGDSGSVAVEIALKMALQYWQNKGKHKKDRFLCFHNGYHGDTAGAMSVSDPDKSLHKAFKNAVIKQYVVDIPTDEYAFAELDSLLTGFHNNIAAVIIEPLVQGAGGMIFHTADTLAEIHRICKKHEILFIADEIATGFGRTGNMFACNEAGITPDIMCVGKALTGGAITMGATLASEEVFASFLSDDPEHAFMHGPTYMANPLACAAANASLDLFFPPPERGRIKVGVDSPMPYVDSRPPSQPSPFQGEGAYNPLTCVESIEAQLREELEACAALPHVVDVRVKGAIGVVQLESGFMKKDELRQKFIEQGVWIRPFGDIVYVTPAFTISSDECGKLCEAIRGVLKLTSTSG